MLLLELIASVVVGILAFITFHFGFEWSVPLSLIAAIVCAVIGLMVIDFDDDWL